MLHARPSHTAWHAHTNIRQREDIMTDLSTTQPFPIRLLLLVFVDAMLFITPLSNTLNHKTELRILCVSPARSVWRISEIICVEWIQYPEANLWLWAKMYLFFLCQVHAMPSSILLDYLRHEHVMAVGGALSSHLWQMQNQIRLGWVSPAPLPPPSLEMKWRILLCSKGLRMFCVSVRRVGLTTSCNVVRSLWYGTETLLCNNLRQAVEMTEEQVLKWRIIVL